MSPTNDDIKAGDRALEKALVQLLAEEPYGGREILAIGEWTGGAARLAMLLGRAGFTIIVTKNPHHS